MALHPLNSFRARAWHHVAIPADAPTKTNNQVRKLEILGTSASAIKGIKCHNASGTNATTGTDTTVTGAATGTKNISIGKLDLSSKSTGEIQAKTRHATASAATSTTFACAAKKEQVDTTAITEPAPRTEKTHTPSKPFGKRSKEVIGRKNHTESHCRHEHYISRLACPGRSCSGHIEINRIWFFETGRPSASVLAASSCSQG